MLLLALSMQNTCACPPMNSDDDIYMNNAGQFQNANIYVDIISSEL